MKKLILLFILFISFFTLFACDNKGEENVNKVENGAINHVVLPKARRNLDTSNLLIEHLSYSFNKLFSIIDDSSEENFIVSPLSIYMAFLMVYFE